jgi:hypothetical protein
MADSKTNSIQYHDDREPLNETNSYGCYDALKKKDIIYHQLWDICFQKTPTYITTT